VADPAAGLLALVAAGVTFPTLLMAGGQHLRHPARLDAVLRGRGWPAAWTRPLAVAVAVVEVALGAVGTVGLVAGPQRAAVALAGCALFTVYTIDVARVVRSGRQAPCGCGAVDLPVNVWVVVRAAAYACLSAVAVLQGPGLAALAPPALLTVAGAVATIGVLLWLLPRALAIPPGFALQDV
jgi:hypothetical protein